MGVNLTIPATFEDALSTPEQIEWLYRNKESLLQAGANIEITRSGDRTTITAVGTGFSPTVEVEEITGGHRVTITDGEGPHVFDVMDGVDGTSVTVSSTSITGGHRLTIVSASGTTTVDVMDGTDGSDGADGDSIVVKSVDAVEGGVNLTVTDKNGDHVIFLMNGPQGLTGPAATIQVGSTTTGEPGSNASVTNVGTSSNAVFNFAIPAGADGQDGSDGTDGRNVFIKYADAEPSSDEDMKDVPSAWIGVYNGTATSAPAHYTSYQWYNFKGAKGDDGTDGTDGAAATITVGSTTTGSAGSSASVTNSGTTSAAVLDFVIPRGADGQDGTNGQDGADGTIEWQATADPTTPNYTFNISDLDGPTGKTPRVGDYVFRSYYRYQISSVDTTTVLAGNRQSLRGAKGDTGDTGPAGADGADGVGVPAGGTTGQVLKKASGTDYDTEWGNASSGAIDGVISDEVHVYGVKSDGTTTAAFTELSGSTEYPTVSCIPLSTGSSNTNTLKLAICGGLKNLSVGTTALALTGLHIEIGDGTNDLTYTKDGTTYTVPSGGYAEYSGGSASLNIPNPNLAPKAEIGKCMFSGYNGSTSVKVGGKYTIYVKAKVLCIDIDFDEETTLMDYSSWMGSYNGIYDCEFNVVVNGEAYPEPTASGGCRTASIATGAISYSGILSVISTWLSSSGLTEYEKSNICVRIGAQTGWTPTGASAAHVGEILRMAKYKDDTNFTLTSALLSTYFVIAEYTNSTAKAYTYSWSTTDNKFTSSDQTSTAFNHLEVVVIY